MNKRFLIFILLFNSYCFGQLQWYPVSSNHFNQEVLTLFTDTVNNKLFIGGAFKYYGLLPYKGVAQWDGNQLLNMNCGLGGCSSISCGGLRQFERFNNQLYALFYEDSIGCQNIHHLAKWDGSSWIDLNQNFYQGSVSTPIASLFNIDSALVVCGWIDSVINLKIHGIVKYNGSVWDTIFYCNMFTDDYLLIHPLIKYNNEIYAQNLLHDTAGNEQIFSKWKNGCWEKVSGAFSNNSGSINKMIVYKNELYIAGSFDPNHDPQAPGHSIAKWDGNHWGDIGGGVRLANPNYLPAIYDMTIYNNELYVAGIFQKAGGLDVSNIAKWDGSKWCSLGNIFDNVIWTIAFFHDSLFAGGGFQIIDNNSIPYFAKCFVGNYTDTCEHGVGIEELPVDQINIFPNPAKDKLLIETSSIVIDKIKIKNILGKKIYSSDNPEMQNQVDISFLNSGLYFLILETKEGTAVKKFIKE